MQTISMILLTISLTCLYIALSLAICPIIWNPELLKLFKRIYEDEWTLEEEWTFENRLDFIDTAIAKMNIEKYMYATCKNNPDYGVLCYKVFDEKHMRGLIVDSAGKQIIMSSFYGIQSRKLGKKILSLKSEKNA